ncbi:HET-domain-containing protein [Coniochaeta hoffmannii]|uniref:HET-domain-containing protein n=1 Tax=Coniochaeta hoffmannii TaxID=91930 RepID=A0AA38S683_9PEZI|nr:HET-domain-containing protein [Coniochaeta hoffmannii]
MWLLSTTTLELHEFTGDMGKMPYYAILSHVWGHDEVSFTDMKKPKHRASAMRKRGFWKVKGFCARALAYGCQWAWVDSCCIDKRSSAELSEAINSMFEWYRRSRRCFVYLEDVGSDPAAQEREFKHSRWFTRAWTLQELLTPVDVVFFDGNWSPIGQTKRHEMQHMPSGLKDLRRLDLMADSGAGGDDVQCDNCYIDAHFSYADITGLVSGITGVPTNILTGKESIFQTCVAQRMCWASRRETTRPEDRAYSLMGLFDVNMPILYGEGLEKAFGRLQHEILGKSDDQTIFAWYRPGVTTYSFLAESPDDFRNSATVKMEPYPNRLLFSRTNIGLRVTLHFIGVSDLDSLLESESSRAVLWTTVDRGDGVRRQVVVFLHLAARADGEAGEPIFFCVRPGRWTFRAEGEAPDKTARVYIEY